MANYLLLRNNKESGPHSLDDLMTLGLKAYDLVWVQGKSAAWRYPSEIEELKAFAPIVEEQPFDRFYKKSDAKIDDHKAETPQQVFAEARNEKPVVEAQYEKYIPKKSVAVTLPGQQSKPVQQPIKEEVPAPVQPTITVSENPAAAQIKYSQPLDDIKDMYVKTLQDRKQKIARKTFWLQSAKKAAVVLSLVAAGVIAGFIIRPNKKDASVMKAALETPPTTGAVKTDPVADAAGTSSIKPDTTNSSTELNDKGGTELAQIQHEPNGGYVNKRPEVKSDPVELKQVPAPDRLKNSSPDIAKKDAVSSPENKPVTGFLPESTQTDPVTGERNRKTRSANTEVGNYNPGTGNSAGPSEKRASLPDDIAGLVSVKSNEYKRVAFGGIRDLQLTVTNDSKYVLENVTVELQYIKPNELPLKTENIQFTSVAPNATSTIRVPDTNRGIRVVFRITHIKKRGGDERVADN